MPRAYNRTKLDYQPYNKGKGKGLQFLESLIGTTDKNCIMWPMFIDPGTGYGRVGAASFHGKASVGFAHRVVCELAHGKPPTPGHEAAHECDVRGCVNPNHLRWKTRSANQLDRRRNGTTVTTRTGCHSKLTSEQRKQIIALKGQRTIFSLAEEYGVHYQTISRLQKHGFVEHGKLRRFYQEDDAKLMQLRGQGLAISEIAQAMDRPIVNVKNRIFRLRNKKSASI